MRENWLSSQLHLLIVLPPMSELYTEYILPEPMILHQNIVPNNIIHFWKNISTELGGQYIQTGNKSICRSEEELSLFFFFFFNIVSHDIQFMS